MPNDFLSNLSSKVLQNPKVDGYDSGLKPRLASRFESNPSAELAVDPAPEREALAEVEDSNRFSRNSTIAPDQSPIGRKHPGPNEESLSGRLTVQNKHEEPKHFFENQSMSTVRDPSKSIPATESSEAFPETLNRAHAQTEFPRVARKDANAVQPDIPPVSTQHSPQVESQKTIESRTIIREVQPTSTDPERATVASDLSKVIPASQTTVVPERIEVTRIERQPQTPPKGSQIVPALELPAFKTQSRISETHEEPPTIHVTIGRIEVKAAPPAAAPKRRASASLTMSLDEYLRRRSGGER